MLVSRVVFSVVAQRSVCVANRPKNNNNCQFYLRMRLKKPSALEQTEKKTAGHTRWRVLSSGCLA